MFLCYKSLVCIVCVCVFTKRLTYRSKNVCNAISSNTNTKSLNAFTDLKRYTVTGLGCLAFHVLCEKGNIYSKPQVAIQRFASGMT